MTRARVLALAIALAAAPARAQPADPAGDTTEQAKVLFEEANKHYNLREYGAAIDSFRKAYDLLPDPEFLFDIAQAYRQLHDCDNAGSFYRTYLRNRPDADNRGKVEKFIAEMDDCAKQDAAIREAERQRKLRERVTIAPAPRPRDHTLRNIGLVTIGVGAIAAGFGAYFSIDGANQASAVQQACKLGCEAADVAGFDRTGKSDNTNAIISYVVGGVAIAAGTGMLLWATLHVDAEVAPVPGGGATVSTRWRF